jgi:DNA-binding LacI/PurR family transcriptional regulator
MLLQRLTSPDIATQRLVFPSELVIRASARARN